MHYRYMMHVVLAILGICTALSQSAVAQTRLGLHVTQEELTLWRQRMTDNVNGVNGYSFQSIYQNRVLADANSFRSQAHPGGDGYYQGWTGAGCAPNNIWGETGDPAYTPGSGGTPYGRGNGAWLMRSAFNFLLTGDASYAHPVRTELLALVTEPGLDFSNTGKWCAEQADTSPSFEIVPWLIRVLLGYDYLRAGGYTGLSAAEQTTLNTWFKNAAIYFANVNEAIMSRGYYHGIYDTPPNYTCDGCPGFSYGYTLYYNGPIVYDAAKPFFNQLAVSPPLSMAMGLITNDPTLINHAVVWVTAFIKGGIYDNGAVVDFDRWRDCLPPDGSGPCPRSMWNHTEGAVSSLIATADMYARAGNTSLYDLTAPTQIPGGTGGTVSVRTMLRLLADMANNTVQIYGTTDGSQLNNATRLSWDTDGDSYTDFSSMAGNLYYNDSAIHTAMTRTLLSGNTSEGCADAQFGGCFSAVWASWADLPFMYGNLEGLVNPYTTTPAGPCPGGTSTRKRRR